jgi:hypothetical protein
MAFNIRQFSTQLATTGLLRDNRFQVEIGTPNAMRGTVVGHQAAMSVLTCEKAVLPGVTVVDDKVRRYGYGALQKKPVGALFTDAQFVFRCGDDGAVYDFLHAWQQVACNFELRDGVNSATGPGQGYYGGELSYKADYVVDVRIKAFSLVGDTAIDVVLRDAWPCHVGDVDVAWASTGNYLRVPAVFSYFDWFREPSIWGGQATPPA